MSVDYIPDPALKFDKQQLIHCWSQGIFSPSPPPPLPLGFPPSPPHTPHKNILFLILRFLLLYLRLFPFLIFGKNELLLFGSSERKQPSGLPVSWPRAKSNAVHSRRTVMAIPSTSLPPSLSLFTKPPSLCQRGHCHLERRAT